MTTAVTELIPDQGFRLGSPGYRSVVAALFAGAMATFTLLYSTQALLPDLAVDFGISAAQSTLSLSVTTLGLGVTLLVLGPLSDVLGRTRLIQVSLITSSLVAIGCALAPTWPALLGLRLLLGITLAGMPAAATAYLREELHPSTHARAAGLYIGGTALGGMAGRLVTAPIAEYAGWRPALAAAALVGLGCALVVYRTLPRSRHFSSLAGSTSGATMPGARMSGATMPGAFVQMGRRALSDPGLLALYGVGGTAAGALAAVFITLGFRLTGAPFHLGLGAASLVFVVYPIGTVSSTVFGRLADAYGRRAVLPIGCVVAAVGALLTLSPSLPVLAGGLALLTAGFFAIHGVASGWVPARAHARGAAAAQAASFYLFAFYLGSSALGTVAGQTWTASGWSAVVALAVGSLAMTAGLAILLSRIPSLLSDPPAARSRGRSRPDRSRRPAPRCARWRTFPRARPGRRRRPRSVPG